MVIVTNVVHNNWVRSAKGQWSQAHPPTTYMTLLSMPLHKESTISCVGSEFTVTCEKSVGTVYSLY